METVMHSFNQVLDAIFFSVISPLFQAVGKGAALVVLRPLELLGIPLALQIVVVALLTAALSLIIRRSLNIEQKEKAFRHAFLAKKQEQEHLHLIPDGQSRHHLAKVIDDDIDQDFNTYLAGRFVTYGLTYLLPLFFCLFWLQQYTDSGFVFYLPENQYGITGLSMHLVFLVSYCTALAVFFSYRKIKSRRKHAATELPQPHP